jgi:plastocyanin
MRRVLLAVLAVMLAAPATAIGLRAAGSAPTTVGIAEREFHITAYRQTVPPGPVKLNIRNFGQDTHNVVVRGPKGFIALGPDVDAGKNATWTVNLRKPGTYQLLCTRANHLRLGMKSTLTVVKPKPKKKSRR